MKNLPEPACPCGSSKPLADCCGPYLDGPATAPDAESLMRSRYTAYVLQHETYLRATWHVSTRPARLDLSPTQWIGLTVKRHIRQDADHARVEFVASYKINGRAHRLHETSRFVCEGGQWFYVDGDVGA